MVGRQGDSDIRTYNGCYTRRRVESKMEIIKYKIKQAIVTKPEIDLPQGSKVVSVKHHDKYEPEGNGEVPECWQVVWLEPKNT